nr:hypothetical protein [Malonomonas rubra]
MSFIKTNILAYSQVTTDGWGAYSVLQKEGDNHKAIVQSKTTDKKAHCPASIWLRHRLNGSCSVRSRGDLIRSICSATWMKMFFALIAVIADQLTSDFGESCNKLFSQPQHL